MRLTPQETERIVATVRRHFGVDAGVAVYGSRLDDAARGGDVDLLVECAEPPRLMQRAAAKLELEGVLLMPVDILAVQRGDAGSPFVRMARARSQALELAA